MSAGIIRAHQNSFSTIFRLLDVAIIAALFILACLVLDVVFKNYYLFLTAAAIALFLLFSESFELYRSWRMDSLYTHLSTVLICWGIVCGILTFIMYFTQLTADTTRKIPFYWMLSCAVTLPGWRFFGALLLKRMRANGVNTRSVIIIGATTSGLSLARNIAKNPHHGLLLFGFCDDRTEERLAALDVDLEGNQIIGNVNYAIELANKNEIDQIYIAMPMSAEKRIQEILTLCGNTTATVHIIPDFFTFNLIQARLSKVGDVQTLSVYDTPINGMSSWMKRLEDIILSTAILALTTAPMLLIAGIIKLTSKGPVLFKQDRYGLAGEKISVWKFRSMTATDNGHEVVQAQKDDVRITPFGAFLRRTSLDELPQFFNVLGGSMSVVGPRPHAVAHNEKYREEIGCYMLRHKVKPGITGWAQINGWRGETETLDKMEKRIEFDLDYLRHWSVYLDLKIVLLTVFKGFSGKHVY